MGFAPGGLLGALLALGALWRRKGWDKAAGPACIAESGLDDWPGTGDAISNAKPRRADDALLPAAEEAADLPRRTTPVVARRMIFAHLGLKLSEEQKQEERDFWSQCRRKR
ncbi:unnamed protein product [Effrenium voratum]|nr:unnamed protein product [Effrenium voratum]